jgi:hypothetical protein
MRDCTNCRVVALPFDLGDTPMIEEQVQDAEWGVHCIARRRVENSLGRID